MRPVDGYSIDFVKRKLSLMPDLVCDRKFVVVVLLSVMSSHDQEQLLPVAVLRNIGDKMYEKRKLAALEVEQIMKKLASSGEGEKVKHLLGKLVDEYAVSGQANRRKVNFLILQIL